jgi:hypothetical protein
MNAKSEEQANANGRPPGNFGNFGNLGIFAIFGIS